MRSLLIVLMGVTVLLLISSCATTKPLDEGELRMVKIEVPENGNLRLIGSYKFTLHFEADGGPEITRVVCICADSGPRNYRPENVRYGSRSGSFVLWLTAYTLGSQRLECYVDYVSEGKRRRSNSVYAIINGLR